MSSASLFPSLRLFVPVLSGGALLFACTIGEAPLKKRGSPANTSDVNGTLPYSEDLPLEPDNVNTNSGAFGIAERPSTGTNSSSGTIVTRPDAGPTDRADAGEDKPPKTFCGSELGVGDLAIVEIMIASKSGSGDAGEWIEIQNTHTNCWLKLQNLSVESPRGAAEPNVATIPDDFELAPSATFVVADSADPAKNHAIPGKVIAWNSSDVLKNDGDTLVVKIGAVQVDTLTYPAFANVQVGRALAFPADCAWAHRSNWARWSNAYDDFAVGFKGTPNAANADVTCF